MTGFWGGRTFEEDRAVVLWGCAAVVVVLVAGILGAALARDDAGIHAFFNSQAGGPTQLRPTAEPERYTSAPPLTVQAAPRQRRLATVPRRGAPQRLVRRDAGPRKPVARLAARIPARSAPMPPDGRPLLWAETPPGRPPVVSLYEDRTLRRGDAVMTLRGIRIFAGSSSFPFRPEDFRNIASSKQLDIPFRKALIDLDRAPSWPS